MTLFRWRSRYLENYSSGDILVEAGTADEARALAIAAFEKHVRESRLFLRPDEHDRALDEDERESYERYWQTFQADIAEEPAIIESGAVFIARVALYSSQFID